MRRSIIKLKVLIITLVAVCLGGSISAQGLFPVTWTEFYNTTLNANNSVTKTGGGGSFNDASVASENILLPGEDGFVEFTFGNFSGTVVVISLSRINTIAKASCDFGFYIGRNFFQIHHKGSSLYSGTPQAGDVFRISREGDQIKYYKNELLLLGSSANAAYSLRVDVAFYSGTCPPVYCSFDQTLTVFAKVQPPSHSNNDGAIFVTSTGGYGDMDYSWSSGESAPSLSNKSRGDYTITVTDEQERLVTRKYSLGFPIWWTNLRDVLVNLDNSLLKTNDSFAWNSGASSQNRLPPDEDGWIEFVLNESTANYRIGLSRIDRDLLPNSIDYAWDINYQGSVSIFELAANRGEIGSILKGDVLKIARQGEYIKYYVNGIEKRSVAVSMAYSFVVDVSIQCDYGEVPIITSSFGSGISMMPTLIFPDVEGNFGGGIEMNIEGAVDPIEVLWSEGEQELMITDKSRGSYSIMLSDAVGNSRSMTYRLGFPVEWSELRKIQSKEDNSLFKSIDPTNNRWDASASSSNRLLPQEDGWIEFMLPPPNNLIAMIGLASPNSSVDLSSIDYGFYFQNGNAFIYESGQSVAFAGNQVRDNLYAISREGSSIHYYVNNQLIHTSSTDAMLSLIVDMALARGATSVISASFARPPQMFYAIRDGLWIDPNVWSLTEGGSPSGLYPGPSDSVLIDGHIIEVNSYLFCFVLDIKASEFTKLIISGEGSGLCIKNKVVVYAESEEVDDLILVTNNGNLVVGD